MLAVWVTMRSSVSRLRSDTKAGRATVIKTIGEDGDRVISAIYEAVKAGMSTRCHTSVHKWITLLLPPVSGEKTAKDLKKTAIRLMLKVAVNWSDGAFRDQVRFCVWCPSHPHTHSSACSGYLLLHGTTADTRPHDCRAVQQGP